MRTGKSHSGRKLSQGRNLGQFAEYKYKYNYIHIRYKINFIILRVGNLLHNPPLRLNMLANILNARIGVDKIVLVQFQMENETFE